MMYFCRINGLQKDNLHKFKYIIFKHLNVWKVFTNIQQDLLRNFIETLEICIFNKKYINMNEI